MNFNHLKRLIFVSAAILILASCMTKSPVAAQTTLTAKIADIQIELTSLDRDTLIELHGSNTYWTQNPFVDFPGIFPRKNIIVFETLITTQESTIEMEVRDAQLKIEDKMGRATTVLYLRNLWKAYKDDRGWSKIEQTTRDYMFPNEFAVDPENPARGYLVFPYNYPKEGGRGLLTIELSTPDGDKGQVELPIHFTENGAEAYVEGGENTGIFADTDS